MLRRDVEVEVDGLLDVAAQLGERLGLAEASRQGRDLGPVAPFLGRVDDNFELGVDRGDALPPPSGLVPEAITEEV